MYRISVFLFFLFQSIVSHAQFYVQGYDPNISQVKICVDQALTLTQDHDLVSDISFDFRAPTQVTIFKGADITPFAYTYDQAGTYSISLLGNQTGAGTVGKKYIKEKYIKVLPTPKPQFEVYRCQNNRVSLVVPSKTENQYDRYKVAFGDGGLANLTTGATISHTYASEGNYNITVKGVYILNDLANSHCGNAITTHNLEIIKQIAPNYISKVTKPNSYCDGQIQFTFDVEKDFKYILEKKEKGQKSTVLTLPVGSEKTRYTHELSSINTANNTIYLTLSIFDNCGNLLKTIPDTKVFTGVTIPIQIPINATYKANDIQLSWKLPSYSGDDFDTFQIYKKGVLLKEVIGNTYIDQINTPVSQPQCYQISNTNSCGIKTISSHKVCPMYLSLTIKDDFHALTWTAYTNGSSDPVNYEVVILADDGQEIDRKPASNNTSLNINNDQEKYQNIRYRVEATTSNFVSLSNEVKARKGAKVFFPTAFSPNGDGLNDTYYPVGNFMQSIQLNIYDQNGTKLFSAQDKPWDGNIDGVPQTVGTYIYIAEVIDQVGDAHQYKGSFVLIR